MWFEREISSFLQNDTSLIQVIRGPRQCGKSSLLQKIGTDFKEISLDDLSLRSLAQTDPELFLKQFEGKKLFIDEAQYAPALFPALKRQADLHKKAGKKRETIFRLTGSNQILMDQTIKESLAGRASFFDMNTFSISEILKSKQVLIQDILYTGGWPELYATEGISTKKYLDDYISSYVEKDIVLTAGIQKSREFLTLIRLLAGRVGQILDYTSLGNEAGVDTKTAKEWISVLEKMHLIVLVQPFSSNLSKRLIKSPKIYFVDTGLACRLQGWTSSEPILTSPQQGHLFENLVFSEIFKHNLNNQLGFEIFHWRSKDGEEVDFLIKSGPEKYLFIEAKVSARRPEKLSDFREIRHVFGLNIPQSIVCHQHGEQILANQVPICFLSEYLKTQL